MVYAFILHTVGSKDVQILYYKIYTCYGSTKCNILSEEVSGEDVQETPMEVSIKNSKQNEETGRRVLFESITEKKELINEISNKVHMHYSLKMKQTLIPLNCVENDTKITGVFRERHWKNNLCEDFSVVWQGVRGFGFTLLCRKHENNYQAQNVLDTLISQLDKQIKLLSEPLVAVKLVETVSLIVNNYIPGGQLIYMNSKMLKSFEKNVELDLYAK